jgi:hypothetical protein
VSENNEKITKAWKGFDKEFRCRDYQYAVGETYRFEGEAIICQQGFHACTAPIDVLSYYPAATSRYAEVELIGETVAEEKSDSKLAASSIRVVREISYFELWQAHRAWVAEQQFEASATGDSGHASATGYSGHASATGYSGHASATGDSGHASATGYRGHASATGYRGHASATGDRGHASATGDSGHASATGYSGHASATGYRGHASATGYSGHASATGENAIAASLGNNSRAKASAGNWIVLAAYGDYSQDYKLLFVKTARCGLEEGDLRPDQWYRLDRSGEFVLCEGDEA